MRVVVTGLGAVSGAGYGAETLWRALCQGAVTMRLRPALEAAGLGIGPLALVELPGENGDGSALLSGTDRASPMALPAAREALGEAGLLVVDRRARSWPAPTLAVCVGTTLGGKGAWLGALRKAAGPVQADWPQHPPATPGGPSAPADWTYGAPARAVAAFAGADLLEVVSTACASGNAALGTALDLLREGACQVALAGGVDALTDFVLTGFAALRAHDAQPCRPFDRRRAGLNLGEGAAFLVLESEDHARRRGARIRARLDGYGAACDANHMTGPDRNGRGMARAIRAALRDADASPDEIGFVSLHGTATPFNDRMECHGLYDALGERARRVPVNSIKGSVGHTLGAAGALEAVMAVRALEQGLLPPTAGHEQLDPDIALRVVAGAPLPAPLSAVLSTSSGFGGINAALLLRRGDA